MLWIYVTKIFWFIFDACALFLLWVNLLCHNSVIWWRVNGREHLNDTSRRNLLWFKAGGCVASGGFRYHGNDPLTLRRHGDCLRAPVGFVMRAHSVLGGIQVQFWEDSKKTVGPEENPKPLPVSEIPSGWVCWPQVRRSLEPMNVFTLAL